MAWSYCYSCEHPFDDPSFSEAAIGHRDCPNRGETESIDAVTRRALLDEIEERLRATERAIENLSETGTPA